jgi:hypothetical protein
LDNPGSVSNASATDVTAFLLQSNDIPAGNVELPGNPGFQAQIRIVMVNPAGK